MDLGLAGRVAVVTGSSQGIGRATALLFGSEGARVAVTCHRERDRARDPGRVWWDPEEHERRVQRVASALRAECRSAQVRRTDRHSRTGTG